MDYVEETIVEDIPMGGGMIVDDFGGYGGGYGGMGMGGFGGPGIAPGCCCSLI